jgi:hypothetical protein
VLIKRDTREKVGYWDFSIFGHEMVVGTVRTADYTIPGLEDIVAIERKKSTTELAQNLGKDSKRFEAELLRMKEIPNKYLILEFTVAELMNYPKNVEFKPKGKVRMNGPYMMKKIQEYEDKYGIEVIFAGSQGNAMDIALEILERVNANTNNK